MPGVQSCEVNLVEATARVRFEPTASTVENLLGVIAAAGYRAAIEGGKEFWNRFRSGTERTCPPTGGIGCPDLAAVGHRHGPWPPRLRGLGLGAVRARDSRGAVWRSAVLHRGWQGGPAWTLRHEHADRCRNGHLVSIQRHRAGRTIRLLAARNVTGLFETAGAIITLVLLGRYLESGARRRTSASIRKLVALQPDSVHVRREGRRDRDSAGTGRCRRRGAGTARPTDPRGRHGDRRRGSRGRIADHRRERTSRQAADIQSRQRIPQPRRLLGAASGERRQRNLPRANHRIRASRAKLEGSRRASGPTGSRRCSCR